MSLAALLDKFQGMSALVVGDLMLDEYIFGKPTRISPEAPVMVIRQQRTAQLPGGAANVCRNIMALGANPTLIGVVGDDAAGELLAQALANQGIGHATLVKDPSRVTTRKTRIVADQAHQVLRVDHEDDALVSGPIEDELYKTALATMDIADVLVISDYLKGALTRKLVSQLLCQAKAKGVPVVVNPKPRSLAMYEGADLISLNRLEASEAMNLTRMLSNEEAAGAAETIRKDLNAKSVLVTLGEAGMVAVGTETFHLPAPKVEVADTAGAGDTVVAAVALGIAAGGFSHDVFELAVQASSCVVRHVGVETPSAEDLATIRGR